MKVLINRCYGGAGLSKKAIERITLIAAAMHGHPAADMINEGDAYSVLYEHGHEGRTNWIVIQVVEELGKEANGPFAELKVVEVPDDVKWSIAEYDGMEHIEEVHRKWS